MELYSITPALGAVRQASTTPSMLHLASRPSFHLNLRSNHYEDLPGPPRVFESRPERVFRVAIEILAWFQAALPNNVYFT